MPIELTAKGVTSENFKKYHDTLNPVTVTPTMVHRQFKFSDIDVAEFWIKPELMTDFEGEIRLAGLHGTTIDLYLGLWQEQVNDVRTLSAYACLTQLKIPQGAGSKKVKPRSDDWKKVAEGFCSLADTDLLNGNFHHFYFAFSEEGVYLSINGSKFQTLLKQKLKANVFQQEDMKVSVVGDYFTWNYWPDASKFVDDYGYRYLDWSDHNLMHGQTDGLRLWKLSAPARQQLNTNKSGESGHLIALSASEHPDLLYYSYEDRFAVTGRDADIIPSSNYQNFLLNAYPYRAVATPKQQLSLASIGCIEFWCRPLPQSRSITLMSISGIASGPNAGQAPRVNYSLVLDNGTLALKSAVVDQSGAIDSSEFPFKARASIYNGNFHLFRVFISLKAQQDVNQPDWLVMTLSVNGDAPIELKNDKLGFPPFIDLMNPQVTFGEAVKPDEKNLNEFAEPRIWKAGEGFGPDFIESVTQLDFDTLPQKAKSHILYYLSPSIKNAFRGFKDEQLTLKKLPGSVIKVLNLITPVIPSGALLSLQAQQNELTKGAGIIEFWVRPDQNTADNQQVLSIETSDSMPASVTLHLRRSKENQTQGDLLVTYLYYKVVDNQIKPVQQHRMIKSPAELFNAAYHHMSIRFYYNDGSMIYQSRLMLSINGLPEVLIADDVIGTINLRVINFGEVPASAKEHDTWFAGCRVWHASLAQDYTVTDEYRFQEFTLKQLARMPLKEHLFYFTDHDQYQSWLLSPQGENPNLIAARYHTPIDSELEVQGNNALTLMDVKVIDFWLKPSTRMRKEDQCILEIADGKKLGNLFGIYLTQTKTAGTPALILRRNRIDQSGVGGPGVYDLPKNRFSYVTLVLTPLQNLKQQQVSYENVKVSMVINGVFCEIADGQNVIDVMNGFPLNFISIGRNILGKQRFGGKIVGPRFWKSNHAINPESLEYHLKAYAYMDFQSNELFGAEIIRDRKFGKLIGNVRAIEYFEPVGPSKKSTAKSKTETTKIDYIVQKKSVFYLAPSYAYKHDFYSSGIDLIMPDDADFKCFDKDLITTELDLGIRNYPFPMQKKLAGYPHRLFFTEVQTIDLWVCPAELGENETNQTLVEFEGSPTTGYRVSGIAIELNPAIRGLTVKKSFVDGQPEYTDLTRLSDMYQMPDLWNGKFHHLCVQIGEDLSDLGWMIYINGMEPIFVGNRNYLGFDLLINAIHVGSNRFGENLYHGQMCGPRFWGGHSWDHTTLSQAAFTRFNVDPDPHLFKRTYEVGRVVYPNVAQEDANNDLSRNTAIDELLNETGFCVPHFPQEMVTTRLAHNYLGYWVNASEEQKIPSQLFDSDDPQAMEKSCIYRTPAYLALFYDNNKKKICLGDQTGTIYTMSHASGESATFVNDRQQDICKISFVQQPNSQSNLEENRDAPRFIRRISLESNTPKRIPSGYYKKPFRKLSSGRGSSVGNIFQHRPPNFNSMLVGYDISKIDPLELDKQGALGNPIFRMPPSESDWVEVVQGMAIPFGWNMIPFAMFRKAIHADFLKTGSDVDESTSLGTTVEHGDSDTFGGGLTTPFGSLSANHTSSLDSKTNRETALRHKLFLERESYSSLEQWRASSHDIILDRANVLFDGQVTAYDDGSEFDFGAGFYNDLMMLKGAHKNEKKVYTEFIEKYGTHFLSSARFGSKGYKFHHYGIEIKKRLSNNEIKIDLNRKSSEGTNVSGGGSYKGVGVNFSDASSFTDNNGNALKSNTLNELNQEYKKDTEEIKIFGAYNEGSIDHFGAVPVLRHFEPIHNLLAPPCFQDSEIQTTVREKLKFYTEQYLALQQASFPRAKFESKKERFEINVTPPLYFGPSESWILGHPTELIAHSDNAWGRDPSKLGPPSSHVLVDAELNVAIDLNDHKEHFKFTYDKMDDVLAAQSKKVELFVQEVVASTVGAGHISPIDININIQFWGKYSYKIQNHYSVYLYHKELRGIYRGPVYVKDHKPSEIFFESNRTEVALQRQTENKLLKDVLDTEEINLPIKQGPGSEITITLIRKTVSD